MSCGSPETRESFRHFLTIPTRWMDNVVYYAYFDTVINDYLIGAGGLDIHDGKVVGVCAESSCRYRAAFCFPEAVTAGLRVGHLGRRSVRNDIGLFKEGREEAAAEGSFVHVFVTRPAMQPFEMPEDIRSALERLVV